MSRVVFILLAVCACGDNDNVLVRIGPCVSGVCTADPIAHCVTGDACTDTADCRSGLICSGPLDQSGVCSGSNSETRCRWTPRAVAASALRALAPASMDVSYSPGPPAQLTWEAPARASVVACAVFRCEPRVAVRTGPTATDDIADLEQITNFDECAMALFVNDSSRAAVPLRDDETYKHAPAPGTCTDAIPQPALMETITAGCWAYDTHQLIAASELVDVDPTTLSELHDMQGHTLHTDDTCTQDGADCFARAANFFGTCAAGTCRPRCTTDNDCEYAASVVYNQASGSACAWRCTFATAGNVGVCEPR